MYIQTDTDIVKCVLLGWDEGGGGNNRNACRGEYMCVEGGYRSVVGEDGERLWQYLRPNGHTGDKPLSDIKANKQLWDYDASLFH